jgi:NADH dehydrogenase [ubiquinone] 1 alpha subcomplex assembly factor 1
MMDRMMIFDCAKKAGFQNWYVVNDRVMGGVSEGNMGKSAEGHAMFQGHVSLDNNGGFTSVRYDAGNTTLQGYSRFVIALKGDGKNYQFRLKTKSSEYYSYIFNFTTTNNWQTIEIPFGSMTPSFRGRTIDMANFPGDSLEEIGFLISNKKEEDFQLAIDYISIQ